MSRLYLIRHGQASFGAEDYDVLSELGAAQSAALGAHLATAGLSLDAIYCGPRRRHRDTARHLIEAARAAGTALPDALPLDELDEYPAFELYRHWLPILARDDPEVAALLSRKGGTPAQIERVVELVGHKWARGELDADHLESFARFCDRVQRGIDRIIDEQGRKKRVMAVTSGGPISVAMRAALGLADETTLKVAWVIANASITEVRYRDRGLGLHSFNALPHLTDSSLVTYR